MWSYSDDVSSVCNADHTFVVHVSWNLDDTEADVYRQIVEMFIRLQDEFSTQLQTPALLIHLIDQHCIKVLVLSGKREKGMTRVTRDHHKLFCPDQTQKTLWKLDAEIKHIALVLAGHVSQACISWLSADHNYQ